MDQIGPRERLGVTMAGVRSSAAHIDAAILDTAAALFALHGVEKTSVQQIADAVGYSKTGLLHRFPSKQAILEGVRKQIDTALAEIAPVRISAQSSRERFRMVAEVALAHPGSVRYLLGLMTSTDPDADDSDPWMLQLKQTVFGGLLDFPEDPEISFRLHLALHLLAGGAVLSTEEPFGSLHHQLPDLLAELATLVVGTLPAANPTPDGRSL